MMLFIDKDRVGRSCLAFDHFVAKVLKDERMHRQDVNALLLGLIVKSSCEIIGREACVLWMQGIIDKLRKGEIQ